MDAGHEQYISECLRLASVAEAKGESSVGALVVKDRQVVGRGGEESRSQNDVTRHAEVVAILDAIHRHGSGICKGATLYSNVEPCILCSYVIRHYGIGEVVYLKRAGEIGGVHSAFPILVATGIKQWGPPPAVIERGE